MSDDDDDCSLRAMTAEALFMFAASTPPSCGPALLELYDLDAIDRETAARYHTARRFLHLSHVDRPPRDRSTL
jgi:hypothetical protein